MPALQTVFSKLNREFADDRIGALAEQVERFPPGQQLDIAFLVPKNTPLYRAWKSYIQLVPGVFHETVQAIMRHALSTSPPTQVTFAWAPSYDHELTIWQAPDTDTTRGGITVLVKGRYPVDAHPLQVKGSAKPSRPAAPKAKRRRGA